MLRRANNYFGGTMKFKTLLLASALFSTSAFSNGLHLSPELKIGSYHGFGMQAGITDVAKSKDTIVCTDKTKGVAKPASNI